MIALDILVGAAVLTVLSWLFQRPRFIWKPHTPLDSFSDEIRKARKRRDRG